MLADDNQLDMSTMSQTTVRARLHFTSATDTTARWSVRPFLWVRLTVTDVWIESAP